MLETPFPFFIREKQKQNQTKQKREWNYDIWNFFSEKVTFGQYDVIYDDIIWVQVR